MEITTIESIDDEIRKTLRLYFEACAKGRRSMYLVRQKLTAITGYRFKHRTLFDTLLGSYTYQQEAYGTPDRYKLRDYRVAVRPTVRPDGSKDYSDRYLVSVRRIYLEEYDLSPGEMRDLVGSIIEQTEKVSNSFLDEREQGKGMGRLLNQYDAGWHWNQETLVDGKIVLRKFHVLQAS